MDELMIEMPREDLKDLRSFLLEKGPDNLDVQDLNQISPGVQREPILIALVIALGGPVVTKQIVSLIKDWLAMKHEERMLKLNLLSKNGKREVTLEELQSL
jgi:hypothetical protein